MVGCVKMLYDILKQRHIDVAFFLNEIDLRVMALQEAPDAEISFSDESEGWSDKVPSTVIFTIVSSEEEKFYWFYK